MQKKVETTEYNTKVYLETRKSKMPVTIDYIAKQCGIGWATARFILYDLVNQGKVKKQKTSNTLIFWVERREEEKKSEKNGNETK